MSDLGRISIPISIRNRLNLKGQDKVIFRIKHEVVQIEPIPMTLEQIAGSVMPLQPDQDIETRLQEAKAEHRQDRLNIGITHF